MPGDASFGPNFRQTRSRQHDHRKCRLKSSQYTLIIPHRVIQLILSHSGSPRQGCASHKSTNKQIPSEASEEPAATPSSIFIFIFFFIHRRALLSANQRQCSLNRANVTFPEHVERSFLDPEYSFVAVRRILPTRFAKKSSPN